MRTEKDIDNHIKMVENKLNEAYQIISEGKKLIKYLKILKIKIKENENKKRKH